MTETRRPERTPAAIPPRSPTTQMAGRRGLAAGVWRRREEETGGLRDWISMSAVRVTVEARRMRKTRGGEPIGGETDREGERR